MDREEKDIEVLISRHLDGELTEDEELVLNRELIRHPEARRLMEGYRRIDGLSAAALDRAVAGRGSSFDPTTLVSKRKGPRKLRYHRGWLLLPGAIAASLLAVIVNQATLRDAPGPRVVDQDRVGLPVAPVPRLQSGDSGDLMQSVRTTPVPRRKIKRDIARDVYGIMGEDGRIYWIEVDRTRTINRPNAESTYRPVSEVL